MILYKIGIISAFYVICWLDYCFRIKLATLDPLILIYKTNFISLLSASWHIVLQTVERNSASIALEPSIKAV